MSVNLGLIFLLVSLELKFISCMTYLTLKKGVTPDSLDQNYEDMTKDQVKVICSGINCPHGFVCQGNLCKIVSADWSGVLTPQSDAVFYHKIQSCKDNPCQTSCWEDDFVRQDKTRVTCCPEYKCGKDCKKDLYQNIKNYVLKDNTDAEKSSLKTMEQCHDFCNERKCLSFNWSTFKESPGVWYCTLKKKNYTEIKIQRSDNFFVGATCYHVSKGNCY